MNQDVKRWLDGLGLGQYAEVFLENNIDFDVLPDLTEADLEKLGLSMGHRKKILRVIAAATSSDGQAESEAALLSAPLMPASESEPEPERRQLTVMFADLVGSTELSTRLDPEDLRELMIAYQDLCAKVIERYDGFVGRYMGDGILVHFGYPRAHEDDAIRAVHAGLAITEGIERLNSTLGRDDDIRLAVRVGIATGLVVVGNIIGEGASEERAVVGETPNLAARLQSLAKPNTVIISGSTHQLIEGFFKFEDLGRQSLRGFSEAVPAYRVREESGTVSRFDISARRGLTPLVGREEEVDLLLRRWELTQDGEGQVVLLSGEAGIGKSRVVYSVRERLSKGAYTHIRYQCSPFHTHSALQPIVDQLVRASGFEQQDSPEEKLKKLQMVLERSVDDVEGFLPLFAAMLSIPTGERPPSLTMSPEMQREKTFEALVAYLADLSRKQPVLIHLEDAQWIDPTTRELFDHIVDRVQTLWILVIVTFRSTYSPPWGGYDHVTLLTINRLSRRQSGMVVEHLTKGRTLPSEVMDRIVGKTDGVPLFVEELTKTVLGSGLLRESGDQYVLSRELPELAIPSTIRDSLLARLDQLAPSRDVTQMGSVIGREFSYELLVKVIPLGEDAVQDALERLVGAELIFRRGVPPHATYRFKHALLQDAAYSTLLHSKRAQLHAHVAEVLESHFPERAHSEPGLMAHHWTQAGVMEKAAKYRRQAGQQALGKSAVAEAVAHLNQGLELLDKLPNVNARHREELELQTALGWALIASKGYAARETGAAFVRARELCQGIGESRQLVPVLYGQWAYFLLCAKVDEAQRVAADLLSLSERLEDAESQIVAHRVYGASSFWRGQFQPAREHLEEALSRYERIGPSRGAITEMFNTRVMGLDFLSLTLLPLGYSDQALQRSRQAYDEAHELRQLVTLAIILQHACLFHQILRDGNAVRERAEALLTLATEQRYPFWMAHASFFKSWALANDAVTDARLAELHKAVDEVRETGATLFLPYYSALLAEAHGRLGQSDVAVELLSDALATVEKSGERWFEAELNRMLGDMLLTLTEPQADETEKYLRRALVVAGDQGARLWELRAASSLARLRLGRDDPSDARAVLTAVYDSFSEGFHLRDLKDASELLETLR